MKLRLLILFSLALAVGATLLFTQGGFVAAADSDEERGRPVERQEALAKTQSPTETGEALPAWPGAPSALDRSPSEVRDPDRARFATLTDKGISPRGPSLNPGADLDRQAGSAPTTPVRNAETITIRGRVTELDCQPGQQRSSRPGVGVHLTLSAHYAGDQRARSSDPSNDRTTVRTNDSGHFVVQFDNPPGPRYIDRVLIRIEEDGRFRTYRRAFKTTGATTDVGSLVRTPLSELRGRVIRPNGAPLEGARIVLTLGGPEEDERVVYSDSRGRWRLRDARRLRDLAVFHDGYRMVHIGDLSSSRSTDCDPNPMGVLTMLAPTGRLEIVTSGDVALRLAPDFLSAEPAPSVFMQTERTARRATPDVTQPDAEGRLTFTDCWAGIPLRLSAKPPQSSRGGVCFGTSRLLGNRLILEGILNRGVPIVVPPGGTLQVELDLGEPVIVRGKVTRANGEPARLARVEGTLSLNRVGAPNWRSASESQADPWIRTRTNQAGEYELALPRLGYEGSLRIVAGYRSTKRLGSGWDQHAAVSLDTDTVNGVHELDLRLIDDSFIEGQIVNPYGEQATYFLRALPAGWQRTDATPETGEIAQVRTASDGSFRLEGLPRGTYDLLVVREPALRHAFDLFRDVESGRDEVLVFTATKKKRARVKLVAGNKDKPVSRMLVMHGRTWLPEGEEWDAGEHRIESPTVWPANLGFGTRGREVETRVIGALFQSMTTRTPKRSHLLEMLDAGWHSFGIQAFDDRGEPYAPVWTGPVRVGQGTHTFRFDLVETTDVVGFIEGEDLPWPMYVALVKNGRKIALRLSKDEPANYVPVGADGKFHLWSAPIGDYEIWVGSAFDLDIGRPQRKQPITITKRMPGNIAVLW